jgi:hypothetical protein
MNKFGQYETHIYIGALLVLYVAFFISSVQDAFPFVKWVWQQ